MNRLPRLLLCLSTLLPLSACAQPKAAAAVEGQDYTLIANPRPFAPLAGKIEVVEVFGYTCSHCAHFEPILEDWSAKQAKDVRLTLVPGAFGGFWDSFASAFYAAQALGVQVRSHRALFDAIHEKRSVPVQNVAPEELAAFYAAYGVKPQDFVAAYKSPQVAAQVKAARDFAARTEIPGTPALVVNGKYLIKGKNFPDMLRIADALVARARAGK
ncbi:thiol:disulfide interchange protein DsbA/DsbL [Xanthomonas theicola]|uniref:Thiol:disulfide interchange protein n=1 Tax=Xanthomonas theicola TaxID=56464 RepID=A0A2S6ZEL3_9XANT|nr:thiol:disulfide interchange protein DsbA/DsbL [Xanthomonas theicola]PPT90714.1 dihydroneopterin aldolase [Xanthomonas theicola]QNH26464.1 thiol:disulfide interchange protein DsbA/DsbL [Xanthomonas theicola]